MYHFKYASKEEAAPCRKELVEIIRRVQDRVKEHFTFRFDFIGSAKRNMITFDPNTNMGFDFDVNIEVNDDEEVYWPKEIKKILRNAFD